MLRIYWSVKILYLVYGILETAQKPYSLSRGRGVKHKHGILYWCKDDQSHWFPWFHTCPRIVLSMPVSCFTLTKVDLEVVLTFNLLFFFLPFWKPSLGGIWCGPKQPKAKWTILFLSLSHISHVLEIFLWK